MRTVVPVSDWVNLIEIDNKPVMFMAVKPTDDADEMGLFATPDPYFKNNDLLERWLYRRYKADYRIAFWKLEAEYQHSEHWVGTILPWNYDYRDNKGFR